MKIVIVNRNEDIDRWQHIQKYNLDAERIVPVSIEDGELLSIFQTLNIHPEKALKKKKELSNILTFRNIIRNAKEENLPNILRLEDDVEFIYEPQLILNQISSLPKDFAICHLGTYFRESPKGSMTKYNDFFIELGSNLRSWGLQAMVINHIMYDKFLDDLSDLTFYQKTLDSYFNRHIVGVFRCFIAHPTLALQKEEFTKKSIHNLAFNKQLYERSEQIIKSKIQK